jgi:two-component system CheB/CheR fusion protein
MVNRMPIGRDISADNGVCFKLSLLPYRIGDDDVHGVAIGFADISKTRAAERALEAAQAISNGIIDAIHESLVVLDEELRIISATPRFYRNFVVRPEDAVGELLLNLCDRCLDVPAFRVFFDLIADDDNVVEDYEIEIEFSPGNRRVLILNAGNIPAVPPEKKKILLAIDDITDRKRAWLGLARDRIA